MAKQIKKIKINLQELQLLICESMLQTKIYCSDANWKCIQPSMISLDNTDAAPQIGEVIGNDTLIILMNSSQKILNIWKGKNVKILYPYICSTSHFEIEIQILSPSKFYLLLNLKNIKTVLGFLIYALAHKMLKCLDRHEKPTKKGKVIENLIDRLLDENLFSDGNNHSFKSRQ